MVALACSGDTGRAQSGFVPVTGDRVGRLAVGASATTLGRYGTVVRDTVEYYEFETAPESVRVVVLRGDSLRAIVDSGRIRRFDITSRRFRTADSLGVGTALSRLLTYPDVSAQNWDGTVWVRVPSHCGLSFRLSAAVAPPESSRVSPVALATLSESTRVVEVVAFGCHLLR